MSARSSHRVIKTTAVFLYALLLSFLFFRYIIVKVGNGILDPTWTLVVGLICSLYICMRCLLSISTRCLSTLIPVMALGQSGQDALRALAFGLLLTGPIGNMLSNGQETVRTFSCTSSLAFNLTKIKYSLLLKPFMNAITNIKGDMSELKNTLNSLDDVISPLTKELLDDKEVPYLKEENDYIDDIMGSSKHSDEIEQKYLSRLQQIRNENNSVQTGEDLEQRYFRKLEYKCNNVLAAAVAKCKQIFEKSYKTCYSYVNSAAAPIVCWPMKITFICNIVQAVGGDRTCDPETEIAKGFGEGYLHLVAAQSKLHNNYNKSNIQYIVRKPNITLDMKTAEDAGFSIYQKFNEKLNIIFMIQEIFNIIILLVFFKIIFNAREYHGEYTSNIEFNNCYITDYFVGIDSRRRVQGKYSLLPLKKVESPYLIDPRGLRRSKEEMGNFVGQLFTIVPEVGTVSAIFIMDRLLYETLDLVRSHSSIDLTQTGEHDMNITVRGTGLIANLVKSLVQGFNFNQKVNLIQLNEVCLPEPKLLPSINLIKVGCIYAGVLVLILISGYTSRLSRVLCSYFYPKREKKRILYLYNKTLKRRIKYYRFMKEIILKRATENKIEMDSNFLVMLRFKYAYLDWLKLLKAARRHCLVCREVELFGKERSESAHVCVCCQGYYCDECWMDASNTCYVCHPPISGPSHHVTSDESDRSDDEE